MKRCSHGTTARQAVEAGHRRPISRLRKIKADVRRHYGVTDITPIFDSGWVPGKGDSRTLYRNVHFRHPTRRRYMIAASMCGDGSARVRVVLNHHDW